MPRPTKWRQVDFLPEVTFFQPSIGCARQIDEVCLSVEEMESIRLKDKEGLQQEECAMRMNISRPTFHRVLESARKKIANALILGKAIRIKGGYFEISKHYFRCCEDGHEWNVQFDPLVNSIPLTCPRCKSLNIQKIACPISNKQTGWKKHCHRSHKVEDVTILPESHI